MTARGRRGAVGVVVAMLLCAACTDGTGPEKEDGGEAPKGPSSSASAGPPSSEKQLDALAVRPPGSMDGYSRDAFPHWSAQRGACDTRETVLERDGQGVRTDEECDAVSGTWSSPFDGGRWTDASDVDIDHVVPLAEAWRSGARDWTEQRREGFANDLDRPQLLAVTDNVNQSKGDSAPDEWKPPLKSYWCTYAQNWVTVKYHYKLSVTTSEKRALTGMLDRCRL